MGEIFTSPDDLADVDFGAVAEADFNAACDLSFTDYIGALNIAASTGAVGTTTKWGQYIKQLVTLALAIPTTPMLAANGALESSVTALSNAVDVLTETGGTLTTDGNEQSVYVNETPAGVFQPVCVKIDCTAHTATESITIKTYYRIKSGGNYILQDTVSYTLTVISPQLLSIELEPNRYGVKVTIQKTAGTNRAYDWEVCYRA